MLMTGVDAIYIPLCFHEVLLVRHIVTRESCIFSYLSHMVCVAGPWAKMRAYRYTKGVDPKQDLENLLTRQLHDVLSDTADDEKDDIPPLIQAITR